MALITDSLTVWDICFRWENLDPDRLYFSLPLIVKDNFRLIMQAILEGEILCETLSLAKCPPESKADQNYYIRTYIDDVYSCIGGHKYNRKLLKWAVIDRYGFREWCEIRAIPLPEFWFPTGWKDHFEMPEGGTQALRAYHQEPNNEGDVSIGFEPSYVDNEAHDSKTEKTISQEIKGEITTLTKVKDNLRIRLCCQQIASEIWKEDISRTIPSIVQDQLIQKYAGASYFQEDTVKGWIKQVAPPEVRSRRGRPRKK